MEKTATCPFCRAAMQHADYKPRKPWVCSVCSKECRIAAWYEKVVAWGSMGLTLALLALLGVRGWRLAIGTVLMWFPVELIAIYLLDRIVQPPLEAFVGKDNSDLTVLKIH